MAARRPAPPAPTIATSVEMTSIRYSRQTWAALLIVRQNPALAFVLDQFRGAHARRDHAVKRSHGVRLATRLDLPQWRRPLVCHHFRRLEVRARRRCRQFKRRDAFITARM